MAVPVNLSETSKDMLTSNMLRVLEEIMEKETKSILEEAHRKIDNKIRAVVATMALSITNRAEFERLGEVITIRIELPKPEDMEKLRKKA